MFMRPKIVISRLEGACLMLSRGKKTMRGHAPVHLSQRPRHEPLDDYSGLGLKFEPDVSVQFAIESRGWAPMPTKRPNLPFMVDRAGIGNGIPVYTDYKAGRTKRVTILRKCRGDVALLKEEMEKIVDGNTVRVHPGRLEVDGNYEKRLKKWLLGLGF